MNMPMKRIVLCLLPILMLALSQQMSAQSDRARILGTVADSQGAVIPSASVTVTNVATGVETKSTTDQEGRYQALQLPIGTYKVKVERQGFKTLETSAYTLEINQVLRLDVKLTAGGRNEVIEVTGEAAVVETVNPTLGASVTGDTIVNLPLNGRNVLALATLEPGVTPHNPDDGSAGTFNIAGARSDSVTFLLDGGVDNNLLNNGVVFTPNPDAVEEFRILTSNYTAEYGRNAGGIISLVTKSGTNAIHGSAFEYNRNDAFEANRYFNNKNSLPKEVLNRNQFGFRLGGPFIKDKLFWSISYQGQRQTQGQTNQIDTFTPETLVGNFSHAGTDATHPNGGVPSASVAAFLTANPFFQPNAALAAQAIVDPTKIDPVIQKYIAAHLIPATASNTYACALLDPADPTSGVCSGTLFNQANATNNNNEFDSKIDYNLSAKDHISLVANGRRAFVTNPFSSGPGFQTEAIAHNYFSGLTYTRSFTPNLLNEVRVTMQRNAAQQAIPTNSTPLPSALGVGVTPDQSTGPTRLGFSSFTVGFSPQGPTTFANNTFAYSDTVSWIKGRHSWKFGGSFTPYQNNTLFDFFVDGQFDIDNFNGAFNQFANGLLGMPEDYFQFGSAPSNIRQKTTSFFVQDEWRISRSLTLTLGTRYEYSTPKLDTQGRSFSVVPGAQSTRFVNAPPGLVFPGDPGAPKGSNFSDKNDWAPRVGFAWAPRNNSKTSIRGGAGMFYDVLKGEDNLQFNGQAPFFGFTSPVFNDCSVPGNCTSPTGFFSDPFGTTGTVNPFPSKPPAKNIDFGATGFLPFGGGGVFFVDPNLRTPYTWQYNLDIQHELAKKLALEVGYVGSQSRKLTTLTDINAFDPATLSSVNQHRLLNEGGTIDDFRFSFLPEFVNGVNANYNALQTKLLKNASDVRFLGNLSFTLSYTWAHTIDNSSGFRNRNSQIPFFQRNVFRASSDFDVRHQVSFSGGWNLPFDHAWTSGPKRLTQGWGLYPIIFWHSGFPLDVSANLNTRRSDPGPSGAGDSGLVFANLTGPITYSNASIPGPSGKGNLYFSGNFSEPGAVITGSYGSGRNILRGPGQTNMDMAFAKKTKITERTAIEIRADFFNLFNHAEFSNPSTVFQTKNFGRITDTADPRIIQFAARFTF